MGSGRFYHPSEGRGVASGTSLSVATPQVCVKTPGKDKTLQAGVHCLTFLRTCKHGGVWKMSPSPYPTPLHESQLTLARTQ